MKNFRDQIDAKYNSILDKVTPYLLTFPGNLEKFNLDFYGISIKKENIFSCIDHTKATFFDLLQSLDQLAFGPVGMPMDKWVFFDCGEMPGAIFGFGLKPSDLEPEVLESFKVPLGYEGLIPISMYIAIPMAQEASWFGHNLSSVSKLLGDKYDMSGLGLLTKAYGIKCFNVKNLFGATQWDSSAMNIHVQLADMELWSAYTPAHSFNCTITYRSQYSDEGMIRALSGEARKSLDYDFLVESKDEPHFIKLQQEIAAGAKIKINGRPIYEGGKVFLPIKHYTGEVP